MYDFKEKILRIQLKINVNVKLLNENKGVERMSLMEKTHKMYMLKMIIQYNGTIYIKFPRKTLMLMPFWKLKEKALKELLLINFLVAIYL